MDEMIQSVSDDSFRIRSEVLQKWLPVVQLEIHMLANEKNMDADEERYLATLQARQVTMFFSTNRDESRNVTVRSVW